MLPRQAARRAMRRGMPCSSSHHILAQSQRPCLSTRGQHSNTLRAEREPRSSSAGYSGSSHAAAPPRPSRAAAAAAAAAGAGAPAAPRLASTRRAMPAACASPSARWSATPLVAQCSSAPPSSSALTSSPVAAWRAPGLLSSVCAPTAVLCSKNAYAPALLDSHAATQRSAPQLCTGARCSFTRPCGCGPTTGRAPTTG